MTVMSSEPRQNGHCFFTRFCRVGGPVVRVSVGSDQKAERAASYGQSGPAVPDRKRFQREPIGYHWSRLVTVVVPLGTVGARWESVWVLFKPRWLPFDALAEAFARVLPEPADHHAVGRL